MAYRVTSENIGSIRTIEKYGKSMLIYDILDKSKNDLNFLRKEHAKCRNCREKYY